MDIITALVDHHQELRRLYQQSEADPQGFATFVRHLIVHHTMEEKYFYDLLQEIGEARHDALEAVNEHHIIELIIKDAEGFPQDHDHFPIKIEGLGEYTVHHLDEEEAEIFPLSQTLISASDRQALGTLFVEAKEKLLSIEVAEVPASLKSSVIRPPSISLSARGLGIGSLK
ncbi:MAG: hemerythrin domain-containing protein [Desulfosarcinaceae bacterium]|nr:hemerythrin domain-containing protein [Desulfosarcinaceae bacterium]